ncbi:GTP 3',8-cyclase MoaA [Clostridium sp. C105KSO13]|uniref:GTP 3',8-cyclase MoaA n=1 Tax=Clostridium sp. C105KSO13 TaxID=1776045 RepID=UPI000740593B|nr:GTP 3',8-cyclase MoaA [Clostridium sp. C105KSO13]CUX21227.1 Cyclic pyranopterin monophosphate synthase [Clostridium sp. C105KSO13]
MIDQYNRKIEYLRVSVTDRCNLRCVYCMPKDGIEQVAHSDILSYDEIIRICRVCAGEGISKIKLTGGEPLVRKDLAELLHRLKEMEGIDQVTLTTNGVLLADQIADLTRAGLDAVNISLDTLNPDQYKAITRRDEFDKAWLGLKTALKYPNISVKVNCVILPGINESQWIPLAGMARESHVNVRFIEMMPIGLGKSYPGSSQQEVLERLEEVYGKSEVLSGRFGNGPAVYIGFPDFCGKIGFISAISHQFCGDCNRVRLTAEGFLKPCLQYSTGEDLRKLLRDGIEDKDLKDVIRRVIFEKPRCHQFSAEKDAEDNLEQKQMSSIGG